MQVGAQDGIDLLRLHAGCAQAVQERHIELMEAGKALSVLVVASTAVQQHGVATGADQPGMDAADQPVFARRIMMRHQPVEMACQHLPLETVEIVFRRSAGEANLLLYPDYRHVSDRPSPSPSAPRLPRIMRSGIRKTCADLCWALGARCMMPCNILSAGSDIRRRPPLCSNAKAATAWWRCCASTAVSRSIG